MDVYAEDTKMNELTLQICGRKLGELGQESFCREGNTWTKSMKDGTFSQTDRLGKSWMFCIPEEIWEKRDILLPLSHFWVLQSMVSSGNKDPMEPSLSTHPSE